MSSVPTADRKIGGKALLFFFFKTPQPLLSNTQQHMDGLPLAVLFVDPAVYFQSMLDSSSIFSKRRRVHMCVPIYTDTLGMHSWIYTQTHMHPNTLDSGGSLVEW